MDDHHAGVLMRSRTRVVALVTGALLLLGCTAAVAVPVPNPDPCAIVGTVNVTKLAAYEKCRLDRIETAIPGNQTVTATVTAPVTVTVTASPTTTATTAATTAATTTAATTATATSTTATPPPPTGFPDATNTGYRNAPGYTALQPCALPVKSNTTYQFCDFGGVSVGSATTAVNNVTFIGCRFKARAVEQALVILFGDNITFDYSSFEPVGTFTSGGTVPYADSYQYGISADGAYYSHVGKLTVTHSDFWGFGNAIDINGSTQEKPQVFRDNWVHDAADDGGSYHTDGIGTLGGYGTGSYMVLDHNTIESVGNTNGIAFQQGSYSDVTITNNLISGWGYAVALWAPAPRTTFTGNTFSTRLHSDYGALYPQSFWTSTGSVWQGNKWSVPAGAAWGNAADDGKFWVPSGPSNTDY